MKFSKRSQIAFGLSFCLALTWALVPTSHAQLREQATVRKAISVLQETMAIPTTSIPTQLLRDAYGLAIIPNVLKGSFILGARFGNGVLLVRDENQGWHAPIFVTLTGGNVGWQVGVQSSDIILVFKTRKSVDGLLSGKFTLGVDAAAAAGPVGRQASAGTDAKLQAEIYSYSRSRGLFAGVSIDGSVIQIDQIANATYYRSPGPGQPVVVPSEALDLVNQVIRDTGTVAVAPQPNGTAAVPSTLAQKYSKDEASSVRDELARAAPRLYKLLDENWQNYLSLPAEIFTGQSHPSPQALMQCQQRFEAVRADPRYAMLASRPEFQSTYSLLTHYAQALSSTPATLSLPAPPP